MRRLTPALAENLKFYIFGAKHKADKYSEYETDSDNCVDVDQSFNPRIPQTT